ncbi:4-alpha-glucanotransferase [Actinoallomurus iriomotensis]|uniref:4-alpha-glucanotransferase n=1 Tax=Actinoallomurus iriomotensis TaxID=478107 RepID=A0A9W6W1Y3_9ACTN|nr:4-alpha-glucanotransferase [Actinoallomurus iriomotensis]GLY86391.1 4-alpha-glucanotransferase [Actinoallomurus iriomotensis]
MNDLNELAAAYGVETSYTDWRRRPADVSPDTIRTVLTGLGADVSSPAAVRAELERLAHERRTRLLPPSLVAYPGENLSAPAGADLRVDLPGGGEIGLAPSGAGSYRLPADVPPGDHAVHARLGDRTASAPLLVAPPRAPDPGVRAWGFMAQLYSARSRGSWGLGDLADLRSLARWSAQDLGAGFVLVNPLHAAEPAAPIRPSPYLPVSRRFTSPLYLRPEDVPEYAGADPDLRRRVDELAAPARARDHTADILDRDAVWAAKGAALELLYALPRSPGREAAYAAYREREGEALTAFATWSALAEFHGADWRSWPAPLRDPASAAVAAERERLADRVGFHSWLQWLLDEQLASVQSAARAAGMPIGVIHDLAVGVDPGGADTWAYQDLFAQGITVGAPPDAFNQRGQDWGQPPWHPQRLAGSGYAPYRAMLRHVLRHAGGLRLDHAMQVFRLWWVPEGAPASEGTYVAYPHDEMLGALLYEAHRADAVVVGEDLGTVEDYMREVFAERGVFGTSMAWFERDPGGGPLPPGKWRELCLATVGTHDMPPIEGYLNGDHVALRERLGLLTRPASEEYEELEEGLREWRELLTSLGLDPADMTTALHAFLARTPSRLIGVSLADAVGERRTQNQPGTTDEYPNWRVPLTDTEGRPVLLDDLPDDRHVRAATEPVRPPGT